MILKIGTLQRQGIIKGHRTKAALSRFCTMAFEFYGVLSFMDPIRRRSCFAMWLIILGIKNAFLNCMKALLMIPASVAATAVVAAGVAFCTVSVLVVITSDIRIIVQLTCKESLYCLIAGAADASIKLDACIP